MFGISIRVIPGFFATATATGFLNFTAAVATVATVLGDAAAVTTRGEPAAIFPVTVAVTTRGDEATFPVTVAVTTFVGVFAATRFATVTVLATLAILVALLARTAPAAPGARRIWTFALLGIVARSVSRIVWPCFTTMIGIEPRLNCLDSSCSSSSIVAACTSARLLDGTRSLAPTSRTKLRFDPAGFAVTTAAAARTGVPAARTGVPAVFTTARAAVITSGLRVAAVTTCTFALAGNSSRFVIAAPRTPPAPWRHSTGVSLVPSSSWTFPTSSSSVFALVLKCLFVAPTSSLLHSSRVNSFGAAAGATRTGIGAGTGAGAGAARGRGHTISLSLSLT